MIPAPAGTRHPNPFAPAAVRRRQIARALEAHDVHVTAAALTTWPDLETGLETIRATTPGCRILPAPDGGRILRVR